MPGRHSSLSSSDSVHGFCIVNHMSKLRGEKTGHDVAPWWHSLNEECPITLELLSTLPYPPFSLTSGAITSYFDGLAIASYIVSRGIFQNPLTREDLTMADCRRLDDYLETYCYNNSQLKTLSTSRKISVAEAFALRSAVHVDQAHQNVSRAQSLQSTATAALAGLFVYGNDRRRRQPHSRQDEPNALPPTLPRDDQLILDWGFDLARTVDESSARFDEVGWTVIDDDEDQVVATQREAYQAAQNAFPRLSGSDASEHNVSPRNSYSAGSALDEHFMERVRELSTQEEEAKARRQHKLELARQQLLREALERREERRRMQQQQQAEGTAQWEKQKQEQEEIDRARAEIEQWREQQWNKLRIISEAQQVRTKTNPPKDKNGMDVEKEEKTNIEPPVGPTAEETAEKKKANAAAKRKRAKERKKAQKEEERAEQEKQIQQKELEAQKAASALQCQACGHGILDSGFEKYGQRFCSPKCARTAQPPR